MDRGIQEEETDLTDHDPLANIQALRYSANLHNFFSANWSRTNPLVQNQLSPYRKAQVCYVNYHGRMSSLHQFDQSSLRLSSKLSS